MCGFKVIHCRLTVVWFIERISISASSLFVSILEVEMIRPLIDGKHQDVHSLIQKR